MSEDWLYQDLTLMGRRERALALSQALGAVMPKERDGSAAHLGLVVPRVLEAIQALHQAQEELHLDASGMVAGFVLGGTERDAGFDAFLAALDAHGVSQVFFQKSVQLPDVEAFLDILLKPPSACAGLGGLRGALERRYIQSIQVHLSAVSSEAALLPATLVADVRRALQAALAPPDVYSWGSAGWLHYVADLRGLGPLGAQLGLWGEDVPEGGVRALAVGLRQLSPDQFVSICRGLGTLPQQAKGLAAAFQRLIPELLPEALDQLLDRGLEWLVLHHAVHDLVDAYPWPLSPLVAPIREGLARIFHEPLVQTFLGDVEWRARNLSQQLDHIQSLEDFLALPPSAQVQLLERALKAHRLDGLSELLGYLGEAVAHPHPARLSALQTLRLFLPLCHTRMTPDYVVQSLETMLLQAFHNATEHEVTQLLKAIIPDYFRVRLKRGQALGLERVLRTLEVAEGTPESHQLEGLSVGWLRKILETDEALDEALQCLFLGERTTALNACAPLFTVLGQSLYHRAAWRLGRESDRQHRDRLLRLLIQAGSVAEDPILAMLRPKMPWYHARNLLVALTSVGTAKALPRLPSFLDHEDHRVRIAALRALRTCARGRIPLKHLIERLEDPHEALRQEAIHTLATLPGREATVALSDMAGDKNVPLPTRIAAVQALGATQSAEALQFLADLVATRKGVLWWGLPEALRTAAVEALNKTPRGRAALQNPPRR